ncbi:MAG: leucine-rich repeat domain-containing protein [Lachnospiraceae bacterium]|nr:leucine-rich repeat domain-containing protein [Lachnospiraceae bacterium]
MGKKIRKAIGAMLTALAIVVTQIPVSDVEAVGTASASDFKMDGTTLVKYNGTATDVSISNSVEKIEAEAFADNDTIKNVIVGSSVEVIGASAFEGCDQLEKVMIPDSVESIEQAAFAGCPSLKTVEIGEGLEILGNGVFAGDTSLVDVNIDSNNPKLICEDGAIYNKNGRNILYSLLAGRKNESYIMPSTVEQVQPYAFWGNKNIQKVSISNNVSEISDFMFSNCANLTDVQIPYSVKSIDVKAFEDCIRLRKITIPASVQEIHSTAFDGCTKLEIEAEEGSAAKAYADSLVLEDIDVAEYEDTSATTMDADIAEEDNDEGMITEEEEELFDYYHEVTHINALEAEEDASVKGKTKIIGNQAFVFIDNSNATVNSGKPEDNIEETENDGTEKIASIIGNTEKKGTLFPKYTIIDESIVANQAYYRDSREDIELPDTITEIGDFAFARSDIRMMYFPEGVTKIGYAAFYHCDSLIDVVIPETVTEIEPFAFEKSAWLENWKENGNGEFLIVGDGILLAYRGSNSIISIPDGVKKIGPSAFANHIGITKVVLSDSVEVIGENAFAGCGNLTTLEGGKNVKQIKDRAFEGCPMQNIKILSAVEEVGLRAFDVTDSVASESDNVVIFKGDTLPTLSFEKTSTKLYNDNYRDLAFAGVDIAVVPQNMTNFDETVLDEELSGFKGLICSIEMRTPEGSEEEESYLKIKKIQTDGVSLVHYPDEVNIGGKMYPIDKVNIPRQDTETESAEETDENSMQNIAVRISSKSIQDDSLASAIMDGAEEDYILKIVDSDSAAKEIKETYQTYYGDAIPSNLKAFDVTLQETDTSIPITGLGRQEMEITIPMPEGVGEENLHVVCLDANGQLEEVESRISSVDGTACIIFKATHFSYYGIYNYLSGNTAKVNDGQAIFTTLSGEKDDSPNTGDNSIHPKWFLGVGLLFTGLALFFYNGKKRFVRVKKV